MRAFIHRSCLVLVFVFFSVALFAQEKTQAYYNTHENEIFPDANAAFREGNYERTIQLCTWHYVFFGTRDAEQLQKKAEQCIQLSKDLSRQYAEGKTMEARVTANSLLSINPDDPLAKRISEELTDLDESSPIVSVTPENALTDTLVTVNPLQEDSIMAETSQENNPVSERSPVSGTVPYTPISPAQPGGDDGTRTKFVIKATASILDFSQITRMFAPGVSLGVYDLGGSRIGTEAGFYVCPGLSSLSASLYGVNADIVFRASDLVYPKVGVGFFSCSPKDGNSTSTNGLCAGLGATLLFGGHFSFEIGAKYYPELRLRDSETVSTFGMSYEFPSSRQVVHGGIVPMIGIGWAF